AADDLYAWLSELPSWVGTLNTWLFLASTVGAAGVVILALLVTRNRRLTFILVAVGVVTAVAAVPLAAAIDVDAVREAAGGDGASLSPTAVVWLAVTTAILLSVAPYLVRPARRCVRATELLAV